MNMKIKKLVFVGLILVTIGATVGGIFIPPLFAIAGTALVGAIGVGKVIVGGAQADDDEPVEPVVPAVPTVALAARKSSSPPRNNLSPPTVTPMSEENKEGGSPPELQRDFSMHISYKTNQHSPGGSASPDAINVSVHTRSPNSASSSPATLAREIAGSLSPQGIRSPSGTGDIEELKSPRSPKSPRTPRTPLPAYAASRASHSASPRAAVEATPVAAPRRLRERTLPSPLKLKLTRKLTVPED